MGLGIPNLALPLTFSIDAGTLAYHWIKNKFKRKSKNKKDTIDDIVFPKKKKSVTVIINSHGGESTIENDIRNIFKQEYQIKNLYISDSNIDDTSKLVNKLTREFPNLHYWSKEGVFSKAKKINHLVNDKNVDLGDYVYLIDSKAKASPGTIEKLVTNFKDEKTAALTTFGFVTPPEGNSAKLFHYGKEWTNKLGKFRKTAQQYRRAMYVVCGASFMVRSDIIKKIKIPIGTKTEDTAYTWLLQEKGYKVGVVQDAVVTSKDVTPLSSQLKQCYRWYSGTWQNIYLHKKELFGIHSKAKSLGYTTILPGLIESSLYTMAVAGFPIMYYFSPELAKAFLIGDTALSLAAPLISTPLAGDSGAMKEFFKTIMYYPLITTYKVMASAIWLYSGIEVVYDALTGDSKEWGNTWEVLPKKIKHKNLDKKGYSSSK